MRIIAGKLGGRTFHEPKGHKTHPMSEKIRGALFNALGDIEGLTFLDAFAGSGALSFEAISRGAKSVVAIEKDKKTHDAIKLSIKELGVGEEIKAVRANAAGWSVHNMEKKFDVVILAPPYEKLQENLLQTLIIRHVKKSGVAALDWPGKHEVPLFASLVVLENKNYGDAQLVFYRRN